MKSEAKIGTFDLNKEAAEAVKAGKIQFCIDQQPYLQGYLAVTQLYLYKKNGNVLGGGQPSLTGPSFVDTSQRRRHPAVHQPEHPLVPVQGAGLSAGPLANPYLIGATMSQTVKTPPAAAPSEASNRVTLGLSNRLLARPEVGALVAADRDLHLLLDRGALVPFAGVVLHRAVPVLDHRHRRCRRRHVDDRWRVRSVGRCPGHLGRTVQRHVLLPARHQPVGRRAAVAGPLPGHRVSSTAIW